MKQDDQPPVGRVPSRGAVSLPRDATSRDGAHSTEPLPRRLRRLHRVWPDRDGNISYLLTLCVDGRIRVLDNEKIFQRLVAFLLDSPQRYRWFGQRFVIMPDHVHLIAHQGYDAIRLGQWVKALKAVVAGLEPVVGRVPSRGDSHHPSTRIARSWRWQGGFHDHKFRTRESEARKWEYICLNPVRCGLVKRPEEWPYGGEIFYDDPKGPRLIRGTPPFLDSAILIFEDGTPVAGRAVSPGEPNSPREGTRPTI